MGMGEGELDITIPIVNKLFCSDRLRSTLLKPKVPSKPSPSNPQSPFQTRFCPSSRSLCLCVKPLLPFAPKLLPFLAHFVPLVETALALFPELSSLHKNPHLPFLPKLLPFFVHFVPLRETALAHLRALCAFA